MSLSGRILVSGLSAKRLAIATMAEFGRPAPVPVPGPLARPVGSRPDEGEERVATGRVRPFAAPGNASENGVNAHRAGNGMGNMPWSLPREEWSPGTGQQQSTSTAIRRLEAPHGLAQELHLGFILPVSRRTRPGSCIRHAGTRTWRPRLPRWDRRSCPLPSLSLAPGTSRTDPGPT